MVWSPSLELYKSFDSVDFQKLKNFGTESHCTLQVDGLKPKADAWCIKKMSNHVMRLRSRSTTQRHEEMNALADSGHVFKKILYMFIVKKMMLG